MAGGSPEIATLRGNLGERLKAYREAAGLTQEQLGASTYRNRSTIAHLEAGSSRTDEDFWAAADGACEADGVLVGAYFDMERTILGLRRQEEDALALRRRQALSCQWPTMPHRPTTDDAELMALELQRRIYASDVGDATLGQIEAIIDNLAVAYTFTSPDTLLLDVRKHLHYVLSLLDGRTTLAQQRRLLVSAGWLSLLAATLHVDLIQTAAARAHLRTAASLAEHAGHAEIGAWCCETEAWRVLTDGDFPRAVELSQRAQALAPVGSSIAVQANAQEGRAQARLGNKKETFGAIARVQALATSLPVPNRPEQHHFQYDPTKAVAYTATTLAWIGDPASEYHAREVLRRLNPGPEPGTWPRRVAAANLDLALALLAADRVDEACGAARQAMQSGRVVPSNHWRANEVVTAIEIRQLADAPDLRDLYVEMRRH